MAFLTRKILLLLIYIILDTTIGLCQNPEGLILATNEFPPYAFVKDGKFTGIAVDIVKELSEMGGYSDNIVILPWKRALQYSKDREILLFPYTRMPYREKSFKWIGPIMSDTFVFAVHRSEERKFIQIEDFRNFQIGVNDSTPTASRLQELAFKSLQIVTAEKFNARKLFYQNRIDAWYAPYLIIVQTIQSEGLDLKEIKIAYKDIDIEMYIAASLSVPDETVALWQKNLDEIKKNGKYQRILDKNRLE